MFRRFVVEKSLRSPSVESYYVRVGLPIDQLLLNSGEAEMVESHRIDSTKRAWRQLAATVQSKVVRDAFCLMFTNHPHLRDLWPFGRGNVNNLKSFSDLESSEQFRLHINTVTAALTLLVENLDKPARVRSMVEDIGQRHFYYGTQEPYFDILTVYLFQSLQANFPDIDLAVWTLGFNEVKKGMQDGLARERVRYMETSMTHAEMHKVKEMWVELKAQDLEQVGAHWAQAALNSYHRAVKSGDPDINGSSKVIDLISEEIFTGFANDTMDALGIAVSTSPATVMELPQLLKGYTSKYYVENVSPYVIKTSLKEGLISTLSHYLGPTEMTEPNVRIWTKLFQVLVQAIFLNINRLSLSNGYSAE